jgi:C4-dicarboxylate-specific signal transduction histidine kinase
LNISRKSGLDLPFIILSGNIGEEIAVGAMKAGAHDYIMKDRLATLVAAVERELREAVVRRELKKSEAQLKLAQAEKIHMARLSSIGELAAGVAHEINNPINGIINYAQLLVNKLDKES